MATINKENLESSVEKWSKSDENNFKRPILEQYELQGHHYYATSIVWDDGIIDPANN